MKKSKEERVEAAKAQIRESMLKWITDAEVDYEAWSKAGSIKRSQVIKEIYAQYPILTKIVDQNTVVTWIDEEINNALKTLRTVVKENQKETDQKETDGITNE